MRFVEKETKTTGETWSITHRRLNASHMIVVLILIVDATHLDAIGIGLMEFLYVGAAMWWTGLLEHAMVLGWRQRLVVICGVLGWVSEMCRWRRRDGREILTSRLLIVVVGTVEEIFLILLFHMQLQLLLWQSRLIYELRWFHVNMVAGCICLSSSPLSSCGRLFMLIEFPVWK